MGKKVTQKQKTHSIYLAGAFFNWHQRDMIKYAATVLRGLGHQVFVPMEHEIPNGNTLSNFDWGQQVFAIDYDAIKKCEYMVAIYEGMDSDSGTAWEMGAAYALHKPVICVHVGKDKASLMVTCGATANLHRLSDLTDYDFDLLPHIPYNREVQ